MMVIFKLLVITAVVLFLLRPIFRLMYPRIPSRADVQPQSEPTTSYVSCEYCGLAVNEKQAVKLKGRYFCGSSHAQQFL